MQVDTAWVVQSLDHNRTSQGALSSLDFRVGRPGPRCTLKAGLAQSRAGQDRAAFSSMLPLPRNEGRGSRSHMILFHHIGKRWSTACAYLHPALSRPNLRTEVQTLVSRVLFEGTRAVGVEYFKNGQSHKVR